MSATTESSVAPFARVEHSRCLLCGSLNPSSLGLHFKADGSGVVTARFLCRENLQGYDGILHGGVIAALLDAAMTHCLFHHEVTALTADMHVRFVRSVSCAATVDIKAWIVSSKGPLYLLRAELSDGDSVAAWAEAKFLKRRTE